MCDLLFHSIKPQNELFIAGYPMNHRISHVLQILCLLLTHLYICLRRLLQLQREVTTARDALTAEFETVIYLGERAIQGVKAVHGAASALKVHYIEFFVEEGVEADLAVSQSLIEVVKNLLVHVIHGVFTLFAELEEVSKLIL